MVEPYRSLLCTTDLTRVGDQAFGVALALAEPGSVVHLVHVCAPELRIYPSAMAPLGAALATGRPREEAMEEARRHLAGLVERQADPAIHDVRVEVLSASSPAEAILHRADALGVDVIVLSDRQRSALDRWLVGSVSSRIRRRARVPVVLVRFSHRVRVRETTPS